MVLRYLDLGSDRHIVHPNIWQVSCSRNSEVFREWEVVLHELRKVYNCYFLCVFTVWWLLKLVSSSFNRFCRPDHILNLTCFYRTHILIYDARLNGYVKSWGGSHSSLRSLLCIVGDLNLILYSDCIFPNYALITLCKYLEITRFFIVRGKIWQSCYANTLRILTGRKLREIQLSCQVFRLIQS